MVVVLLDSLNRHLVGAYGGTEFDTPNIDRLAARSVRFTRHYTGSLPCMPARHDLLTGAIDFLWRPWGSIEIWEDAVTYDLRRQGVTTMLVSDHPHLFEVGGENYHTDFTAWDYVRGHEDDPWRTAPDPSAVGAPSTLPPPLPRHYEVSRTWFRDEADFPGPRTMTAARRWLTDLAPRDGRFLLVVDEFDPHEPFDTPEPWASRYDPTWQGPRMIWPPYSVGTIANGVLTPREAAHVRASYGAKLSMIDHWLGGIIDAFDEADLWSDTALVLCTDHGHYLGEHDLFGKPGSPVFEPMGHLPLLVAWPGRGPGDVTALTTTVDLHATICDVFGVTPEHRTHGHSLVPLLAGDATGIRDWAVMGIWGREVHVTDGRRTYARAPGPDNSPLSMWSNRWSTMPVHALPELRLPRPDHRAVLDRMPGSTVPVIRQPFAAGDPLPFWARRQGPATNHLYDVETDPDELENRAGEPVEAEMLELLHHALAQLDAPSDQYERLALR
jgi:arylsulfatase A-like enzyme